MPKFIPYNYDQTSMVVINYKDNCSQEHLSTQFTF